MHDLRSKSQTEPRKYLLIKGNKKGLVWSCLWFLRESSIHDMKKYEQWVEILSKEPLNICMPQCYLKNIFILPWHECFTCKVEAVWHPSGKQRIVSVRQLFSETMMLLAASTPNGYDFSISWKLEVHEHKNHKYDAIPKMISNHCDMKKEAIYDWV